MSTIVVLGAIAAVLLLLLTSYFINRSEVRRIETIGENEGALAEIARPDNSSFSDAIREIDSWAHGEGFNPHKLLQLKAGKELTYIATWQDRQHARTLLLYHNGKVDTHEIVSRFGDGEHTVTLRTSDDRNAHALPAPPGFFTQNFSYANMDVLLGEHLSGEAYIEEKFDFELQPLPASIRDELLNRVTTQCDYVKSLAMWQLKGPYWYLFRRLFRSNAPVKSLY